MEDLLQELQEIGKKLDASVSFVDVSEIVFDPDLRINCEQNSCGSYGRNWVCPPKCGPIDECIEKAKHYQNGYVIQTVGQLEDSYDYEGMMDEMDHFHEVFVKLTDHCKGKIKNVYPLSAGGCRICSKCAVLDEEPCRHPGKAYPSIESHGIYVSDLAQKAGMKYINGVNTVTYFGVIMF